VDGQSGRTAFAARLADTAVDVQESRVMAAARKPAGFVHLRVKSAYSLLEGAVRPA